MSNRIPLLPEEDHLANNIAQKWITVISAGAFSLLGLWMVLSPAKPKHAGYEKVTVALLKDLWGLPFGLIILAISIPVIVYCIYRVMQLKNYVWYRVSNGHYLFDKGLRLKSLTSMRDKDDLYIFHPEKDEVLLCKNYYKCKLLKYFPALLTKQLSNDKVYWNANQDGYAVVFKGKFLANSKSEYRGDDLIVSAENLPSKFLLKNYKNSKDDTIRIASVL